MLGDMTRFDRRELLRWLAAAGGVTVVAGCPAPGDDGPAGPDATAHDPPDAGPDGACRPTTEDVRGPFFVAGAPARTQLAGDDEPGDRLVIDVEVLVEGCEAAAAGVVVDIWQADRDGVYHDAGQTYRLRGQVLTPSDGRFEVRTIRPGNYTMGPGLWRPAHLHFMFVHPGFRTVTTQLYFAGDPYLPPNDPCGSCTSEDTDRVVALTRDADGVLRGAWRVVLRRA
jgi:catechol 1,2-dioxygenase